MIRFVSLLSLIAIFACNGKKHKKNTTSENEDWQIFQKTNKVHSYTKSGLLEKTMQTDSLFINGKFGEILSSQVLRQYDIKNNLIKEITFQLFDDGKKEMNEEKLYKYDTNGNLINETDKYDGSLDYAFSANYDKKNRKVKEVIIRKNSGIEKATKNWAYDTTIIISEYGVNDSLSRQTYRRSGSPLKISFFIYDSTGKLISQVVRNNAGDTLSIFTNEYLNGEKNYSFEIRFPEDTTSIHKFEKDGDLVKETIFNKLGTETCWYLSDKLQKITTNSKQFGKTMYTYKYDAKGNEIESILYK